MTGRWILAAFGALVCGIGLWVTAQPDGLPAFAELFLSRSGFWTAVAFRLAIGVLLWVLAGDSRTPVVFRVLGALMVISGLALPLIGLDGLRSIAEWGRGLAPAILRVVGLLTAGLGAFIAWSILPRRSEG